MTRQSPPAILLTRPASGADRLAQALRARLGDQAVILSSPLLAPEYAVPDLPPGPFAALALTSDTAVAAYRRFPADLRAALPTRAWCVGPRTALSAAEAGLAVTSGSGDAAGLARAMQGAGEAGPILWLRGADVAADLATALCAAGIPAASAVVYDQQPQALTAAARALLSGPDPVLAPVLSPRSAALLAAQVQGPGTRAPIWLAALSPAVARAWGDPPPARLAVAAHPDQDGLLDAVADLWAAPRNA